MRNLQILFPRGRQAERGAALISALLIATLLLIAGGALILTTTLSATNAIDSAAEAQAYYGAEAGLQATLNVLRGNIASGTPQPTFRNVVDNPTLSPWITYSTSFPDRVPISGTGYAPINGVAYGVLATDPDNTVSPATPSRLLIQATGFGPRGAVKRMELTVSRFAFGFEPPAAITMIGAADPITNPMHFTLGSSNAKEYSGHDHASGSTVVKPSFGTTSTSDNDIALDADNKNTAEAPKSAVLTTLELPPWLSSADSSRAFLNDMQALAQATGRLFGSFSGNSGSTSAPAFTFVNGDCNLDGGAGLLIVTGNLTLSGNPSFNGVVLVLGNGRIDRNGGGNGNIYGAVLVASFARTWPSAEEGQPHPFRTPWFDTDGGGNSKIQYDSAAVENALNTSGNRVLGVREY